MLLSYVGAMLVSLLAVGFAVSKDPYYRKLTPKEQYMQVIAHRGACGYLPEHSLQAYQLAIDFKADYIEPDLGLSKDGIFVALHDLILDNVTNIKLLPQFAARYSTKMVDSKNVTGFFVSDFLYSELQEISLIQRYQDFRSKDYDGIFKIPTMGDVIDLIQKNFAQSETLVGMYIELKHPEFYKSIGFDIEDMLLNQLSAAGIQVRGGDVPSNLKQVVPVVVQSFDPTCLKSLRLKSSLPLVHLVENKANTVVTEEVVNDISAYASGVGIAKSFFTELGFLKSARVLSLIKAKNLVIHPYTFRADHKVGGKFYNNSALEESYFYCCLGVDGLFVEFPDKTRQAIQEIQNFYIQVKHNQGNSSPLFGVARNGCDIICENY